MILIDTSVLIDILHDDPHWAAWSAAAFESAVASDDVAIDDIVYAELSAGFGALGDLDGALATLRIPVARLPRGALFLVGQAFKRYRRASGSKSSVLSDFFIGAHAAVEGAALLTRDPRRIRNHFPTVRLIEPS
jgi:predicted nucleic acid-binding protein